MNLSFTVLVSLSILSLTQSADADPMYYRYKKMMHDQAVRSGLVVEEQDDSALVDNSSYHSTDVAGKVKKKVAPPIPTYTQLIDHFAKSKIKTASHTFKQRYFMNSTYAKGKDSPVIYYICGEATCEGSTGTPLVDAEAKKYGAYRVALEHRYYGTSQPFKDLTTSSLAYLSMDQAVEDLASFQKYISAKLGLTGKWIVIGGSYAGELSAFYRLKHPELVVGSLASSAPVLSKADFFEYDRHVATVITPACLAAIQTVVKDVESKLLQPDSAAVVKAEFESTAVVNDVDFLYVVADMGAAAIQYGMKDQFCQALTTSTGGTDALTEAYATVGKKMFAALGETAFQDSFQAAASTDPKDYLAGSGIGDRSWMYQSCTEFGYYQIANTNLAESARSQQITQQYHNDVCNRLFGITAPVDTVKTNAKFFDHLADPSTTHIFFTNGSTDPWSNLSLSGTSPTAMANPNLNFFLIDGASHCSDLGQAVTDALTSVQKQFDTLMGQWLTN